MYRKINDFINDWDNAAQGTTKVLESLTNETLDQAIVEGHNTLGWLGWHLATSPAFFASIVGLEVKASDPKQIPDNASTIVEEYKKIVHDIRTEAQNQLTDEKLNEEIDSMGMTTTRGAMLRTLIDHQTHHRGQMTVLLRQAGLTVPGVMGPTKEEGK
ncbi:DinB family protein [Gracilibacillus massiliensis]|uniref:DinB family protein n=1 Tax=Gracilibacillus massiliensis TaxID=1564956 RepID=UPI00071D41F9|nr:DinB family protein [Gracilibacillus massiliensis]